MSARPLTDEEIEYFMTLKPLSEVINRYGMRDFERALEGLQNFDTENEIDLFEDEDWLEHLEEIKAQYDAEEDSEDSKPAKKSTKKVVKKVAEPEDDEEEDEPEDNTEEDSDEEDDEEEESGDEFDRLDRSALKKYIVDNDLEISVKKSMSDDDLRNAIRSAKSSAPDVDDEDEDEEEDEAPARVSLGDIRKKLAGKK